MPRKTVSLWSYVNRIDVLEKLLNPLYTSNKEIIWPSVAPMSLVIEIYDVTSHRNIKVHDIVHSKIKLTKELTKNDLII